MKPTENPVCTTDFDLPTPPWGHDTFGDPGEPHPDEPGLSRYGRSGPPAVEPLVGSVRSEIDEDN
jgi:hypothetical protein